ncbi:hypothetical protein PCASD_09176 [Puccinia coronata f. sp. avenae]|uniref:Uncharacterized protein n=1 Tax=Puccinia coronata f. sp. avenae TaxID=200324 RepID=A0A2N5TGG6_9BASI|nr:hypothetical protein PCASD_09176 [Puccinia coronata f. sp. avenae]
MDQVETLPSNNTASDHPPDSQTSSDTPEYPLQPFVTMPEHDIVTGPQASPSSFQPADSPSYQSPSTASMDSSGHVTPAEQSDPLPVTVIPPASHDGNASSQPGTLSDLPSQTPAAPPSQSSFPSDQPSSFHPDEPKNVSVTVEAIPRGASQHSSAPSIPPPSRGAIIAFGVLTVFFVTLIIGLLFWRSRQNRSKRKDPLAKMSDQNPQSSAEKGDSATLSRSSSGFASSQKPLREVSPKAYSKRGAGPPNPFSRRGITRPNRPASLPLHSKNSRAERIQKAHSQEVPKHHARPTSWRSSIASAWESLGLPSRVLHDHDPNSHFWADEDPEKCERSPQHLVDYHPSAISEETSCTGQGGFEPSTAQSHSQSACLPSSTFSRKSLGIIQDIDDDDDDDITLEPDRPGHLGSPCSGLSPGQPSSQNLATESHHSDSPSQSTPADSSSPDTPSSTSGTASSYIPRTAPGRPAKTNPKLPVLALDQNPHDVTEAIAI